MQTISLNAWTFLCFENFNEIRSLKKVAVAFDKNERNGLKRECLVITPSVRNSSVGIRLINEKGRGWMEVKDWDISSNSIGLRFGLFIEEDTLVDSTVIIDFTFWDRTETSTTAIGDAQISFAFADTNDPNLITKVINSHIRKFLL